MPHQKQMKHGSTEAHRLLPSCLSMAWCPRGWGAGLGLGLSLSLLGGLTGCKELTGSQQLPSGTKNPGAYQTPAGAMGMRTSALYLLEQEVPQYLVSTGLLTDELQDSRIGASTAQGIGVTLPPGGALDPRILPEVPSSTQFSYVNGGNSSAGSDDYAKLQQVRLYLMQAIEAIAAYDTGTTKIGDPRVMRGELYALEGYTEILLADFFCSGVPLTTLDFNADYTYHAGSTTAEVYRDAISKADSALALADTSSQVLNLARVIKGRALLSMDNAAAAATAVAAVPDGFQYQLAIKWSPTGASTNDDNLLTHTATVANNEGVNGLPYISSGDPRTAVTDMSPNLYNVTLKFPAKYSKIGFTPFTVANGIEARLIQAEAALRTGNVSGWLSTLNTLRTTGFVYVPPDTVTDTLGVTDCGGLKPDGINYWPTCGYDPGNGEGGTDPSFGEPDGGFPVPIGYSFVKIDTMYPVSGIDPAAAADCYNNSWYIPCWEHDSTFIYVYVKPATSVWAPGTGGVAGLATLADPGATLSGTAADSARTALLFKERAYWLFVTGHRQGDLRRLLRQYSSVGYRTDTQVYPTGSYPIPPAGATYYGTDVTAAIPPSEYLNPLYHGCIDRNP